MYQSKMYLSQLKLNLRSAQARRDVGDGYELHRTLVRAFVAGKDDEPPRFLWRLEPTAETETPTVLVQSADAANWEPFQRLPNYLIREPVTKLLELAWLAEADRRHRFRLVANPTVCRSGKRLALRKETEQFDWLGRKAAHHGFSIEQLEVRLQDLLESCQPGCQALCVQRVWFEGVLRVSNPELFTSTLVGGIGPAKAFGCGLLSVAPC